MTTTNVTLFFVLVLGTIAFCLYDFSSMPFKENLKVRFANIILAVFMAILNGLTLVK